jgi:hypothetical protein
MSQEHEHITRAVRSNLMKQEKQQALRRRFAAETVERGVGKIFKFLDEDQDGEITRNEFHRGMEKLGMPVILADKEQVNSMFAAIDTDGNGVLGCNEVAEFMSMMAKGPITVKRPRSLPTIKLRPANFAEERAAATEKKFAARQEKIPFSLGVMVLPLQVPKSKACTRALVCSRHTRRAPTR